MVKSTTTTTTTKDCEEKTVKLRKLVWNTAEDSRCNRARNTTPFQGSIHSSILGSVSANHCKSRLILFELIITTPSRKRQKKGHIQTTQSSINVPHDGLPNPIHGPFTHPTSKATDTHIQTQTPRDTAHPLSPHLMRYLSTVPIHDWSTYQRCYFITPAGSLRLSFHRPPIFVVW